MYPVARSALFALDAERAHDLTLGGLSAGAWPAGLVYGRRVPALPCECMGLRFANPVGLAAGLDKNGDCIDGLGALGFGFIEVGTVTPRAQPGNPKPRLFRLPEAQALINRMGFNNRGVDHIVKRLRRRRYAGVVGVNIGKNADTPLERAEDDYRYCLERVYPYADYVVVNLSSPNTIGLRRLQQAESLDRLLDGLQRVRGRLEDLHRRRVPLAVKIAPDLEQDEVDAIAGVLRARAIDAVVATNTTIARPDLAHHPLANEAGGLSGVPLAPAANRVIRLLAAALGQEVPIIGVGGVHDGEGARAKRRAGARLVQIYSGLIYRGPALVRECVEALAASDARQSQHVP